MPPPYDRLSSRAAIITGAASGIGQATAKLFLEEGAHVVAVDIPEADFSWVDERPDKSTIRVLAKSVSDDDAPQAIVEACLGAFGRLDILMNNAGVGSRTPVAEHSDEDWDRVNDINVRAQFRLCRQAIPHLAKSEAGRIINVASVMAEGTDFGLGAYCASKAGVAGLTRTLALELGRSGITANYIEPGAILTGMTKAGFDDPQTAKVWGEKASLGRLGQPIDIARGALFLASDDGAFVTGHGLRVDGGLMLRV